MTSDRTPDRPSDRSVLVGGEGCDGGVDPRVARSQARVLGAATELLAEEGPAAVTVEAICERSGVARSTLYRHWSSQAALLVDVIRVNMPSLPDLDPSLDFEGALRVLVSALAAQLQDPHWCRIMPAVFLLKRQMEEVDAISETETESRVSKFHHVVELGRAEGRLPADVGPSAVMCTVFGPLVLAALVGGLDEHQVGERVVSQFLAAYPRSPAT